MRFIIFLAIASIILLVLNSSTNANPWFDTETKSVVKGSIYDISQTSNGETNSQRVSISSDSDEEFKPSREISRHPRKRVHSRVTSSSSSPSVTTQILNGKYIISVNHGDCIYKPGKIIENDSIRSMTFAEKQKIQQFLNGEINVPCFCSTC